MKKKSVVADRSGDVYSDGTKNLTRTTIFLTETLNENLDALALKTGEPKGALVRQAVSDFLKTHGLQPDKRPKVTVSY
jgi:hypothetical protein